MPAFAAAGAAFLVAVLWFDLMFDVQVRGHRGDALPPAVLASISGYYRRVTTQARPMNRIIPLVMLLTVVAVGAEIVRASAPWWAAWPSLAAALSAIGLAMARTVRNAVRLGAAADPLETQSRLARQVWADHLFCLVAMGLTLALQLSAASV
jgi:hypothetical protein